ncbi:hypothetical protein [uncultured Litoreibacter sp.]|uniref:hypothetical protein n=1 Tax=uncultured Litoreibacter sp. TaxID=1392394 RepID=UPI002603FB5F|nr:hypothetical protein [uncultured Litoreibacter sp.]
MNYEAQLITLRRISAGIKTETIALDTKALPQPGTHSHQSLSQKIDMWHSSLIAIARGLEAQQGLLNKMAAGTRGDYSAQQSHRDKSANIAGLRDQCLTLLEELAQLLSKLNGPERDGIAMANALKHALKNITKEGEALEIGTGEAEQFQQVVVKAAGPVEAPVTYRPNLGTGLITLAVFLLVAAKKMLDKDR